MTTTTRPATRWASRHDIPALADLDAQTAGWRGAGDAYGSGWFRELLAEPYTFAFVAGGTSAPDGFAVYRIEATHLHLLRFAALPGTGAGAALGARLFGRLDVRRVYRVPHVYYATPDGPGAVWDRMPEVRPEWMTADVRAMLSAPRPPEWCGVLADALQDAGCDDDGLLSDLREEGIGPLVWQWIAD